MIRGCYEETASVEFHADLNMGRSGTSTLETIMDPMATCRYRSIRRSVVHRLGGSGWTVS